MVVESNRVWTKGVICAALTLLFLAPHAVAQEGKRLVWAQALTTGCLDPARQARLPDWNNIKNIYSTLLNHVPGSLTEVAPDLATSWEVSDDGIVYTFHLRQGVQWHEGYGEVTAEDVKYSWERLLDPATGSTNSTDIQGVEAIEAPDPYTVILRLREPAPAFLSTIANSAYVYVVNRQALEERGTQHCVRPIGSGPYRVAQAEVGGGVLLEAVDYDHHLGRPAIRWVEMRVIPEESVAVLALIRGDLDFIFVREYHNMANLAGESSVNLNVDVEASNSTYVVWLNTEREPLNDVRVRQALAHATDRRQFAIALSEGLVTEPAHTFVPPSMFGHTEELRRYAFDPEEARRLLSEAGYGSGLSLSIQTLNTSFHPLAATLLQAMWREVGVELEIDVLELGVLRTRQSSGEMDMTLSSAGVAEVSQALTPYLHSANIGGQNYARYSNETVDNLLDAQAAELDFDRRRELLAEAQGILAEELPGIPLMHMLRATAARSDVTGIIPDMGWWRTHFYWMDMNR